MAQSCVIPEAGKVLDTMIGLTRLTPLKRVIVAGESSMALCLELRQRGFMRAMTPALCRHRRAQHALGFVAGRHSGSGIKDELEEISGFMTVNAGLALLIGSGENSLEIRTQLEKLGFRIEAGVRCAQGLVLSASRQGFQQMAKAA